MKILFIDFDFLNMKNGASTRSKFLLRTLAEESRIDLLVLDPILKNQRQVLHGFNLGSIKYIATKEDNRPFLPGNLTSFSKKSLEEIIKFIGFESYTTIFVRFYVHERLISLIKEVYPSIEIIIDVDLLFSNFCLSMFLENPTVNGRYYLFEYLKLKHFEKEILKKDYTFLFSNQSEMETVKPSTNNVLITNPMILSGPAEDLEVKNYILLYGNLDSSVMQSSFTSFIKNIYPKIKYSLEVLEIKVHLVGTGDIEFYQQLIDSSESKYVEIIGEVTKIKDHIKSAQLVIFPVIKFGGTLTRLMETIECEIPIVATRKIVMPLGLSKYIPNSDNFGELSMLINKALLNNNIHRKLARECFDFTLKNYGEKRIARKLTSIVK
jgi:glycosyltransferase involved in cell wall biosynthesis